MAREILGWAPRVGLLYDWTKEGRSKIYAHWGRFYESIPMDINDRSFGGEVTYEQLFASKDVDAIYIATPPYFHPAHLEAALASGKHVYLEKPMALTLDDVRAFFGSGTDLQELYIQPGKLTREDWQVLASRQDLGERFLGLARVSS